MAKRFLLKALLAHYSQEPRATNVADRKAVDEMKACEARSHVELWQNKYSHHKVEQKHRLILQHSSTNIYAQDKLWQLHETFELARIRLSIFGVAA